MDEDDRRHWGNFDQRLGSVERVIAGQEAALLALSENQRALSNKFGNVEDKLDRIVSSVSRSQQTDWKALSGMASVILGIVVFYNSMTLDPVRGSISRIEADVTRVSEEVHERALLTEMARAGAEDAKAQIKELDITLQREMRLLDDTSQAKLAALDTMLQREVRLLLETQKSEIKSLQKQVDQHEQNLNSRRNGRWNKDDQLNFEKNLRAELLELREDFKEGSRDRWSGTEQKRWQDDLHRQLNHRFGEVSAEVRGIQAELQRRTEKVYGGK